MERAREQAGPPEQVRRAAEELGAAVLPVLFGELGRAAQRFEAIAAAIARRPERGCADEAALGEIERRREEAGALGWCLGVLGSASGSELLLERRDARGLEHMVRLLAAAIDVRPEPAVGGLPRLVAGAGRGWEVPFLGAHLFLRAGAGQAPGAVLRWSCETFVGGTAEAGSVVLRVAAPPGREALDAAALVPGARSFREGGGLGISLPPGWTRPARQRP